MTEAKGFSGVSSSSSRPTAPWNHRGYTWEAPNLTTKASGAREPAVSSPFGESRIPGSSRPLPPGFVFNIYNPETGEWETYTYGEMVDQEWMPKGLNYGNYHEFVPEYPEDSTSGSRDGGGGGSIGPTYQKPDRRLVEESVKGMLSTLTGSVDPNRLKSLTDLYMSEHQRAWATRETQQIDPMEAVKAKIRDTGEYKAIHQLRPDSVDEYDWVSSRQGALLRAGVTPKTAEQLGIAQATIAASTQDATEAGNLAMYSGSGKMLDELKGRIRTAAYGALRLA